MELSRLETNLLLWWQYNLMHILWFSGMYSHAKFQMISVDTFHDIQDFLIVRMLFDLNDVILYFIGISQKRNILETNGPNQKL